MWGRAWDQVSLVGMWHLRVSNSEGVGSVLGMEVRADGSLEKGLPCVVSSHLFPSFQRKKRRVAMWENS